TAAGAPCCDPCAPAWCEPISRVPNFLGDPFARGVDPSVPLRFTGVGAEGFDGNIGSFIITAPVTANGPRGPYTLTQSIPYNLGTTFPLPENGEMTGLVRANFPGAIFVNGGGSDNFNFTLNFFYDYTASIFMSNPSGGGLVGRNKYFENG